MAAVLRVGREHQDVDAIHGYLTRSYWAEGITRERVAKSLDGSLCFGLFEAGKQVGFARVISDCVTFAYLCVLPTSLGFASLRAPRCGACGAEPRTAADSAHSTPPTEDTPD